MTALDPLRSRKQTREIIGGVCNRTLRRMELQKILTPVPITGRKIGYRESEIQKYLESQSSKSLPAAPLRTRAERGRFIKTTT